MGPQDFLSVLLGTLELGVLFHQPFPRGDEHFGFSLATR